MTDRDFSFYDEQGETLLCNTAWRADGFLHGMTTSASSFSKTHRSFCARGICELFGAEGLVLPNQVHGRAVIDCRSGVECKEAAIDATTSVLRLGEADALVLPPHQPIRGKRLLFGVLTADCVPIILRSVNGLAVIHAGWRGLAQGIIQVAAEVLGDISEGAIFASAGGERYEVGPEVVQELGASAVFSPALTSGKLLLDTAGTAMKQLARIAPTALLVSVQICTISDSRFHSFRRDGDRAGRCLTFVCPPDPD